MSNFIFLNRMRLWSKQIQPIFRKFDALSRRERILVLLAMLGLIGLGGYRGLIQPQWLQYQSLGIQINAALEKRHTIQQALHNTVAAPDQSSVQLERLHHTERELAEVDEKLLEAGQTLIPAEQMPLLLEALLTRVQGLKLVGLRKLSAVPLTEPASGVVSSGLFKQGIEIKVEGRYADLVTYLESVEQLPYKMLWHKVMLEVQNPPKNLLTLTIYTLSKDSTWLSL